MGRAPSTAPLSLVAIPVRASSTRQVDQVSDKGGTGSHITSGSDADTGWRTPFELALEAGANPSAVDDQGRGPSPGETEVGRDTYRHRREVPHRHVARLVRSPIGRSERPQIGLRQAPPPR